MNNQSKAFIIVSSIFLFIYYIVLLICLVIGMKYTKVFMVGITIGIAVAMALAGIMYGIRANEPENKLTFQKAVEKTILCGIYFGITCGLLYILAKDYGYNLELLILSAILLAGILASIGTSIPWQSLIGIGIVILGVPLMMGIRKIKKYREESARKQDGYEIIPMNNRENFKTN
jgi:hypothetical protein